MSWVRQSDERRQYWQTIPLRAYVWVVVSAFLIFFSIGFEMDPTLQLPIGG
jgi:Na+-transporting methylmalonyl-CoA/oxaloacetate decarboxylase beta subunit